MFEIFRKVLEDQTDIFCHGAMIVFKEIVIKKIESYAKKNIFKFDIRSKKTFTRFGKCV